MLDHAKASRCETELAERLRKIKPGAVYGEGQDQYVCELLKGQVWDYPIEVKKCKSKECHSNCYKLYGRGEIITGYAFANNRWYRHSWLFNEARQSIIETTIPFEIYYGVKVEDLDLFFEFLKDGK